MRYYAKIEGGVVRDIINAPSHAWCVFADDKDWVETVGVVSIGDIYDGKRFYPPQPYPSWTLGDTGWEAPTRQPKRGLYVWSEENSKWLIVKR